MKLIDEEAQRVAAHDLCEQHLDLRLSRGKAGFDIRLQGDRETVFFDA